MFPVSCLSLLGTVRQDGSGSDIKWTRDGQAPPRTTESTSLANQQLFPNQLALLLEEPANQHLDRFRLVTVAANELAR